MERSTVHFPQRDERNSNKMQRNRFIKRARIVGTELTDLTYRLNRKNKVHRVF